MVWQNIGKYRVLDRVGRGGMGTVYRAIDETLQREVAIKVLNAELNEPEVAKRFRGEAITVARLSHPGIATIYELFQHDGQWLMVMEFVRGETLERLIERTGPQTPQRAAELCMQSLAALAHAHAMGVVHRDLKPANIMLTENGSIKIMDFGIARVAGTEHLTNAGFMMGTPAYMAPEQVLGHEIDARADIYAMGVVLYRLIAAQLPFKGETPFAMAQAQVNNPPTPIGMLRAGLPMWVEQVMTRSLAKRPEERFQSASEFYEELARSLSGQSSAPSDISSAPTSLMSTPPQPFAAAPSGEIAQTMLSTPRSGTASGPAPTPLVTNPAPSGPVPSDPSASMPTMQTGGTWGNESPAYQSGPQAPVTAPAAAAAAPKVSVAPPARRSSSGVMVGAAAALIVLAAGAYFMFRPGPAPAVEPSPAVNTAPAPVDPSTPTGGGAAAPSVPSAVTPAPPRSASPPVAPPPAATTARGSSAAGAASAASTVAATGAVAGERGSATAAARGAAAEPLAAAGRRGTAQPPAPAVDDTLLAVTDVRVLVLDGKKANDQEALLNFGGGQIVVLNRRSGTPVATLPYRSILSATYIRARDPRWNTSFASPPDGLDVGGMLRTSKHYLTLQAKDSFQILRLEDSNVVRVLQAVEARTGVTIDRPRSNDRD